MPSDPAETPRLNIYDQWVLDAFGIDVTTYAVRNYPEGVTPSRPLAATPETPEVDADVAAITQGMEASQAAGHQQGIRVAQVAVPGIPLPLPIPPDAVPALLPPSVERDLGRAVNRAGRRLDQIGREVMHGDLADAAGHALLGHPFPPQVDDPGYVPPAPMPPVPGTTPLSDADRRLAGRPETFPIAHDPAPDREGFTPLPAHIPDTTAHPIPAPTMPSIVAASNLASTDLPRTPGLGPEASMQDIVAGKMVPGRDGVVLTDPPADVTRLYPDMHKLFEANGVEYALVRRADGKLVLSSGSANRVRTLIADRPLSHTHPRSEPLPSIEDIRNLNSLWASNRDGPRPTSTIVWGANPEETTPYGATGLDDIPRATKRKQR